MKALILWGIGMSGGIAVAAGLFTFLVITGIPHRLMTITHTTAYGGWYEWMFVLGGALGNAVWLTDTVVKIPAGMFLAGAAGLLVGIFIGCLSERLQRSWMHCRCFSKESVSVRASVSSFSGWPSAKHWGPGCGISY